MMQNAMQQAGPAGGEGGENTPLGQIGVRATLSVTFDLIVTTVEQAGEIKGAGRIGGEKQ